MNASRVARRYSTALFELARKTRSEQQISKDLERVVGALQANPDVAKALYDPLVPVSVKDKVLVSVGRSLVLRPLTRDFLAYLNERKRLAELEGILEDFGEQLDEAAGQVRAQVASARPLSTIDSQRIKSTLQRVTSKRVVMETSVDSTLIGGVVTRVGNVVFDGSVRRALDRIRAQLLNAAQ